MSAPGWRLPEPAADHRPTYLAHALALAALHGPGPWPDGGHPLPDAPAEQPFLSEAVFEGIRTHHGATADDDAGRIAALIGRIAALAGEPPTAPGTAARRGGATAGCGPEALHAGEASPPAAAPGAPHGAEMPPPAAAPGAPHGAEMPPPAAGQEALHDTAAVSPPAADLRALHDAAAAVSPLSAADALVRECRRRDLDPVRLRDLGRWLAEHGSRRSAVAIGIVLIGVAGDARDRSLLLLLGALDDLTLYATVALLATQPDRERAVFDLARRVDGWGRIHAVERLAGTDDPEIRAWLLRDGYRNRIMDEYLAYLAATTGHLADALADALAHAAAEAPGAPTHDGAADAAAHDALLDGAGGILLALCRGGPAQDMTDYADGPVAVERYLDRVGERPPTLPRIGVVAELAGHLGRQPWPADVRDRLTARCTRLTGSTAWRARLATAIDSDDPDEFRRAVWPATTLGIPIAGRLRHHVRRDPHDLTLWMPLVDDPDEFHRAVDLATEVLPLADLATGPSLNVWRLDGATGVLDIIVSRLDDHPGTGWPLIRTALSNATVRNRIMALNALEAWPAEALPPEATAAVREALRSEPDDELRARMSGFLRRGGRASSEPGSGSCR